MKHILDHLPALETRELCRIWDRAFLHYTPAAPDRWCDPELEFDDFFDAPQIALPLLEKIGERDRLQAYVEYFAAVWRTHFQPEEWQLTLPVLSRAAEIWQDRNADLQRLIRAIQEAVAG